MKKINNLRIRTKLHVLTCLATLAILVVAATLLLSARAAMMDDKRAATRGIVDSAHSIVAQYHQEAVGGRMSEPQAKAAALAALRAIRYGDQDYVWVNDMHPTIVMHPLKPELDGQDASGITDPQGNALFVRFVETVRGQGSGFVQYLWPKPGRQDPVPKLSYVKGFAPWGWVVGSGIYIDDVAAAFRANVTAALLGVALATGLFATLSLLLGRAIGRRMEQAVDVARKVATGDLTARVEVGSGDEIGLLLQALGQMNASLASLVRQVRKGTEEIATASGEIAAGNQDLAQRNEEQASSLEQTAASTEELSSTVRQNGERAARADQLARSASGVASEAGAVVGQLVDTIAAIRESSRQVAEITGLIDSIAFQTNILALNAAVEAARAGDQGRGVAVVASEVRTVAERSAAAAREIRELLDASQRRVESGSALGAAAGQKTQEAVASIGRLAGVMAEVALASREQTCGIEQMEQAMTQMDRVTQQNSALVEQAAAAAQSLSDQAAQLLEAVSVFKLGAEDASRPAAGAGRPQTQGARPGGPARAGTQAQLA
jgi:methyl-accepting chemotaxis protein